MIMKFELSVNTETNTFEVTSIETGETKTVDMPKVTRKRATSKAKKDENPNPQLTLEDNKYSLNTAAVELMSIQPDDKLDIKYEKNGMLLIPVIGTNESFGVKAGNRVTKSFTVSCRGKANDELRNYGTVFDIEPHSSKEGLFILVGEGGAQVSEADDNVVIDVPTPEEEVSIDLDMSDFTDDDTKDITALDFSL